MNAPASKLNHTEPLHLDVEQGSDAWFEARRGIPTASNFKRILTATGRRSEAAPQYLDELVREYHDGRTPPQPNQWMARGIELEPEARAAYQSCAKVSVAQTGLVYLDDARMVAASPDGLVNFDGLLEIKCPMLETHLGYRDSARVPAAHVPQVQGQLWVTGRKWCDFFSYHPGRAPHLIRAHRDEAYIGKLRDAVLLFVEALLVARQRRRRR